ncbi:unnamed protein product [Bursaphelenchus okinawaensis]|uniref:Nucleoprotein TPR n=1 Tax=Bursaphelenchus okinawaensis TaxID=465554 RepID=A0A811KA45_9BILA|nr:unnamed protein product [Bursaphelenchus okinawaensis]CAG9098969.1 unnamed protein product [Bursaphelenchus okinawaensis]
MEIDQITRQFHVEREQWNVERDKLQIANETYLKDIRKLNEAEQQVKSKEGFFDVEKEALNRQIEDLKGLVQRKDTEVADIRREASEKVSQAQKERAAIEIEINLKDTQVKDIERVLQLTQDELDLSRKEYDEMSNRIDGFLEKIAAFEASIQTQAVDFEQELRKRDEQVAEKQRTIENLIHQINESSISMATDTTGAPGQFHVGNLNLLEENADLRKKLAQLKAENDHNVKQRHELLKEFRQRQLRDRSPQSDVENLAQERCKKLEEELNDYSYRCDDLNRELEAYKRRNKELEKSNSELITQFTSSILPFDELIDDNEYPKKFNHFKEVVEDNLRLRQTVEDLSLQLGNNPMSDPLELQDQFEQALEELDLFKKQAESSKHELENAQKMVEYYKTKVEVGNDFMGNGTSVSKADAELQIHKLNCEINTLKDRVKEILDEKIRNEENQSNVISQKNELIAQLYSTKDSLELKVKSCDEATENMQSELEKLDKTNRKIKDENTKLQASTEAYKKEISLLNSQLQENKIEWERLRTEKKTVDLELSQFQREVSDLRARCQSLSDNQTVTNIVLNALTEFRSAYSQINAEQLHLTQAELENCRQDRDSLNRLVSNLQNQQMSGVDALKTALRDAKMSSERYRSRCAQAEQDLESLRSLHTDLEAKYEQLNKQLTDIDSADADPDSCKKENQHLKNKIIYYEKQAIENNAVISDLKAQLEVADSRFNDALNTAELYEKSLKEKDLKLKEVRAQMEEGQQKYSEEISGIERENQRLRGEKEEKDRRFNEELQIYEAKIEEHKQKINDLFEEKNRLENELATANQKLEEYGSQFSETSGVLQSKDSEIDLLKNSLEAVNKELTNTRSELQTLYTQNQELTQSQEEQRHAFAEKSQEQEVIIVSLKNDIAEYEQKRLETHPLDQSVYEQAAKHLDEVYDKLNSSAEAKPDTSFKSRLSIGASEKTISLQKHVEMVNKLNLKLENQERELAHRLEQMSQLETLKETQQQYESLQLEYSVVEKRLNSLQEDNKQLNAQLKQLKHEHSPCSQKITSAEAAVSALNGQINLLKTELQKANDDISTNMVPKDKMSEVQKRLESVNKAYNEVQSRSNHLKALAKRYRDQSLDLQKELEEVAPDRAQAMAEKHRPQTTTIQGASSPAAIPTPERPQKRRVEAAESTPTTSEPQQKQSKEE